ncbi:hypothetical protein DMUE_5485 [Dictyocoela muelleri]|nr:hypothetical protein DMUE_5485 [Dictyocoela muelleri]
MVSRHTIESFLGLMNNGLAFKQMLPILNVSKSTVLRLYKRYLSGEFDDLSQFISASEKKSRNLKNFAVEKNIIQAEIFKNPCINLDTMSETLNSYNNRRYST